jgi:hypothetical protein
MTEHYLITTRYNNKTVDENKRLSTEIKCIYSNDTVISHVSSGSVLFVLEMNNRIDEIVGIGMINTGKFCAPV